MSWIGGSNILNRLGTYGQLGIESSRNRPGARFGANFLIDPSSGLIYLFGGYGYASSGELVVICTPSECMVIVTVIGYLNDLWQYNISNNEWVWVGGSNITNSMGTYGQLGIASSTNWPGGRESSHFLIDLSSGLFYLFGGLGYASSSRSGNFYAGVNGI